MACKRSFFKIDEEAESSPSILADLPRNIVFPQIPHTMGTACIWEPRTPPNKPYALNSPSSISSLESESSPSIHLNMDLSACLQSPTRIFEPISLPSNASSPYSPNHQPSGPYSPHFYYYYFRERNQKN